MCVACPHKAALADHARRVGLAMDGSARGYMRKDVKLSAFLLTSHGCFLLFFFDCVYEDLTKYNQLRVRCFLPSQM